MHCSCVGYCYRFSGYLRVIMVGWEAKLKHAIALPFSFDSINVNLSIKKKMVLKRILFTVIY